MFLHKIPINYCSVCIKICGASDAVSTKTWLDVWTVELEDSMEAGGQAINEEWRNGVKYLKLKAVIDLCKRYRVHKNHQQLLTFFYQ